MVLRKADRTELPAIWEIIQHAIEQRRRDGSRQWQDGYPNLSTLENDLDKGYAYVLEDKGELLLYAAVTVTPPQRRSTSVPWWPPTSRSAPTC